MDTNMHRFGAKSVRGRRWIITDFERYNYDLAFEVLTRNKEVFAHERFLSWVNGMLTDYNIIWGCGLI